MAKATRIDSYQRLPDGRVMLKVTRGETPLPLSQDTEATEVLEFANEADFMASVEQSEAVVAMHLHMVQAGKALKSDPLLGATFRAGLVGRTPVLDLVGSDQVIRLG